MKKETKNALIILLIVGGCIVTISLIVVAALAIWLPFIAAKEHQLVKEPETTGIATEYPITNGQTVRRVYDTWSVKKNIDDGVCSLFVWNSGQRDEELEYLHFNVYDNEEDARARYEEIYEQFSEYSRRNGDRGWDEGVNWFTSLEPGVCDASIVEIICIEDNVIISADIQITSEWGMVEEPTESTTSPEPTESRFDISVLKDYVILHSAELKDYVINVILGTGEDIQIDDIEIRDGYVAVLKGGLGELMRETYVYKTAIGYRYINATSTTESWGSTHWKTIVNSYGELDTKEEIVEVARENYSDEFVVYPGDSRAYTIDDFLNDDQI